MLIKESQTIVSAVTKETVDAATQTTEFEYLFCAMKIQPFTEYYFRDSDGKTRFSTGLPDFDVLISTFHFFFPYVTRKTKTLSPFQEFSTVSIKL